MSEPGAVATGSKIQFCIDQAPYFCRRLKPALKIKGDVIPGLRSLRSLTRGYYLPPLRGLLSQTSQVESMPHNTVFLERNPTNRLTGARGAYFAT